MSTNKKQKKEDVLLLIKKQNLFLLKKIILLANMISKIKHDLPLVFPKYVKEQNFGILKSEQHRRQYDTFISPCVEIQKQLVYCSLYTFIPKALSYMWITEHHVRNILFSVPFRMNFFNLTVIDNEIKMIHTEQVRVGKILSYFPNDKEYSNWVESFIFNNVDRDHLYNRPVTYFHIKSFSFENFIDGFKYFLNELPQNSKKIIGYNPKQDIQYYLNKAFKSSLRALLFNFYNFEDKKFNNPTKVYEFFNHQNNTPHNVEYFSNFISSINSCGYDEDMCEDDECDDEECDTRDSASVNIETEQPPLMGDPQLSFQYRNFRNVVRPADIPAERDSTHQVYEVIESPRFFTLS